MFKNIISISLSAILWLLTPFCIYSYAQTDLSDCTYRVQINYPSTSINTRLPMDPCKDSMHDFVLATYNWTCNSGEALGTIAVHINESQRILKLVEEKNEHLRNTLNTVKDILKIPTVSNTEKDRAKKLITSALSDVNVTYTLSIFGLGGGTSRSFATMGELQDRIIEYVFKRDIKKNQSDAYTVSSSMANLDVSYLPVSSHPLSLTGIGGGPTGIICLKWEKDPKTLQEVCVQSKEDAGYLGNGYRYLDSIILTDCLGSEDVKSVNRLLTTRYQSAADAFDVWQNLRKELSNYLQQ